MNRTRTVSSIAVKNRYVLRDGQVIDSDRCVEGIEVLSYQTAEDEQTHLLLSDAAEVKFLMRSREDAHYRFV